MIAPCFDRSWLRRIALLAAFALLPAAARADHAADPALPGHSVHGDSFDEGPRQAAYLMGNTGDVHIAITTKSPDAQKFFDQGLGQLHGFWYLESERSFRQAAALDPDCAMAYWGMAMANVNNGKRAATFIAEAVKRKEKAGLTELEAGWIDALAAFHKTEKAEGKRNKKFIADLKSLREKFPEDVELKAFVVLFTWEYKMKEEYAADEKLLAEIFAAAPNHPAHHYRIHLLDGPNATKALGSAAMCGQVSSGIAHMWHMPGHIFSDLNRYVDAAWQQEASARVDHAYMIRDRVMPYEIHNYAHNNEWLIRDLMFVGRAGDAIDLAKNMIELPRHPKYNQETNRGSGAEYGRSRLLDVLSQHQMWPQMLELCEQVYLSEDGDQDQQIRKLRFQGIALMSAGRTKEADACIAKLTALKSKTPEASPAKPAPTTRPTTGPATQPSEKADSPKLTARPTTGPATRPAVANGPKRRNGGDRGNGNGGGNNTPIDRAIAHINAERAIQAHDFQKAATLLNTANARKEHISQAYLAAGDKAKAEELAKQAVNEGNKQTYPLANYVAVLHAVGKKEEAAKAFTDLRKIAAAVDLSVEPYKGLRAIAADYGYESDWRAPRDTPSDIGIRPALDTLGPFRWHPATAPDWSAVAADGTPVSLSAYKGKPVVVLFYLGHGCLHCVRQINAFAPLAKRYADAGIAVVAISTDEPKSLNQAWEGAKLEGGALPFPLVSDSGLGVFKAYHCYDDFEKTPMHGTFLIDGDGKIRWQDISYEPFMDASFLLKESKRLLAQPKDSSAAAAQRPAGRT